MLALLYSPCASSSVAHRQAQTISTPNSCTCTMFRKLLQQLRAALRSVALRSVEEEESDRPPGLRSKRLEVSVTTISRSAAEPTRGRGGAVKMQ